MTTQIETVTQAREAILTGLDYEPENTLSAVQEHLNAEAAICGRDGQDIPGDVWCYGGYNGGNWLSDDALIELAQARFS